MGCNLSFTRCLNASYLEMDGQLSVDWISSKNMQPIFKSLTIHAVNLLPWKKIPSFTLFKILTVTRPSTLLRILLMGRSECPTKRGELGGGLSVSPEISTFPFYWISPPPKNWISLSRPWSQTTYWKKSLIDFRQILSVIFLVACIFSYIIMTYVKKLVGAIHTFHANFD